MIAFSSSFSNLDLICGTDIVIPSGWKVHPVFSAIHLDPTLHPNPQQFNPSRWSVCNLPS